MFKTYEPLYKSLGYGAHYVPTHSLSSSTATVSTPTTTVTTTHNTPVATNAHYYAPPSAGVLTPDLRNTYAGLLAHQRKYLVQHEEAMKITII
jgi:hypothetical protein